MFPWLPHTSIYFLCFSTALALKTVTEYFASHASIYIHVFLQGYAFPVLRFVFVTTDEVWKLDFNTRTRRVNPVRQGGGGGGINMSMHRYILDTRLRKVRTEGTKLKHEIYISQNGKLVKTGSHNDSISPDPDSLTVSTGLWCRGWSFPCWYLTMTVHVVWNSYHEILQVLVMLHTG